MPIAGSQKTESEEEGEGLAPSIGGATGGQVSPPGRRGPGRRGEARGLATGEESLGGARVQQTHGHLPQPVQVWAGPSHGRSQEAHKGVIAGLQVQEQLGLI